MATGNTEVSIPFSGFSGFSVSVVYCAQTTRRRGGRFRSPSPPTTSVTPSARRITSPNPSWKTPPAATKTPPRPPRNPEPAEGRGLRQLAAAVRNAACCERVWPGNFGIRLQWQTATQPPPASWPGDSGSKLPQSTACTLPSAAPSSSSPPKPDPRTLHFFTRHPCLPTNAPGIRLPSPLPLAKKATRERSL